MADSLPPGLLRLGQQLCPAQANAAAREAKADQPVVLPCRLNEATRRRLVDRVEADVEQPQLSSERCEDPQRRRHVAELEPAIRQVELAVLHASDACEAAAEAVAHLGADDERICPPHWPLPRLDAREL